MVGYMSTSKWQDVERLKRVASDEGCLELLSNFASFTLAGFVQRYGVNGAIEAARRSYETLEKLRRWEAEADGEYIRELLESGTASVFLGRDGRPVVLFREVEGIWKLKHRWKEITLCLIWALLWGLRRQGEELDGMHFVVDHNHRAMLDFSVEHNNQVVGLIIGLLQDPSSYSTQAGEFVIVTSNTYVARMFRKAYKVFPNFFKKFPVLLQTHEDVAKRASHASALLPCFFESGTAPPFVPTRAKLGDFEELVAGRGFHNLTLRDVIENRVALDDLDTTHAEPRTHSRCPGSGASTTTCSLDEEFAFGSEELEDTGGENLL
mmetsp:Transcript_13551/g.33432  ORF Transcript_13551/g.33432 Transcript_13551/m.33432 type:complete len:322 (+) Transcript_13551:97-1062(+)